MMIKFLTNIIFIKIGFYSLCKNGVTFSKEEKGNGSFSVYPSPFVNKINVKEFHCIRNIFCLNRIIWYGIAKALVNIIQFKIGKKNNAFNLFNPAVSHKVI